MPALALTDKANLFGAPEFGAQASDQGIQPIHGAVLKMQPLLAHNTYMAEPDELLLIAQNQQGFENLMVLVSDGFLQAGGGDPLIPMTALTERAEGLIALTGALESGLGRALDAGQDALGNAAFGYLAGFICRAIVYGELQRHGLEAQKAIEPKLFDLAYDRGLPLVATNAAHFMEAGQFKAHEALMCIGQSTTITMKTARF